MRRRGVLAAAFAVISSGCAAAPQEASPVATIAYRQDGKLIMLPVRVGDAPPVWFALDSGASHTVLDPRLTARLGLKVIGETTTTGVGAGSVPVQRVGPLRLSVGGAELAVADPWVIDLSGVSLDKETRGLVGAELFERYVVRLDTERRTVALFEPAAFRAPKAGATLPLTTQNGRLFLDAMLEVKPGLTVPARLRIDTGSESSVNHEIAREARETRGQLLGQGLGASSQGLSGRHEAVRLGPYTIRDVWGPGGPTPSIGMELLRRFVVTFDVSRGRLHLQPNAALHEPVPAPPAS